MPDFLKRLRGPADRAGQRRTLRERTAKRDDMLLELGALVFELHRQGRRAPELLQAKAAELERVDGEVRRLAAELEGVAPPPPPAPAWSDTGEWEADEWPEGESAEWDAPGETGEWEATQEWDVEPEQDEGGADEGCER